MTTMMMMMIHSTYVRLSPGEFSQRWLNHRDGIGR